ncbi:hypothetical protein SASPL_119491 [Salvia splendens]|uniref:C2H2-type domain-containing protein n=1 Tax=Salvia splendens TaxID=180675 RepID=A0A8X8XR63_SALSN|nr:zinc finger protein ZAT5-like [Salvia splendens]KAG6417337.1 hypothetical protein SASPL_119491 [Salvia splendens]
MSINLSEEFKRKRHRPSAIADVDSNSSPSSTEIISANTEEDEDLANCLILLARGRLRPQSSRRKFAEDAYECKTCSRTFASFQALGGHRASHRKPNSAAELFDRKIRSPPAPEAAKFGKFNTIVNTPPPPIKLQMSTIHECSICGSEFASGQALGGHMRRHRSPPPAARSGDDSDSSDHDHRRRNVFSLDLNFPAPLEEFSKPRLIFAAAAADCHY